MNNQLNIIVFNVPYPPDYGGVIDVFYRIKALHQLGIKIHLHCFEYGRKKSEELEALCQTVTYYKRKQGMRYQFSALPYIVATRTSDELVKNLSANPYPILFDGLHTTFCLNDPKLKERIKIVRMHNIEHQYYRTLAKLETNLLKKAYLLAESAKLKRYEKILAHATQVMCVSHTEHEYFEKHYHNSTFIPSSHPYNTVEGLTGYDDFLLYHGDLSVNENQRIAAMLVRNVFSKISYPCVIAGKNPPGHLVRLISRHNNIRLISNPNTAKMQELLTNAHVHVLPVLHNNGLKLKLLLALYTGRHCLVNPPMVDGTYLEPLCSVAQKPEEMIEMIHRLMKQPFSIEQKEHRKQLLARDYNNLANAEKLVALLDG